MANRRVLVAAVGLGAPGGKFADLPESGDSLVAPDDKTVAVFSLGGQNRWDDLRFPATLIRQGATTKPDFDITNLGLLFPQNDSAEIAYIIGQMSHKMLLGSDLSPHIHFIQSVAQQPTFKIDYRWYKQGNTVPGAFTTITASTFAFTWSSGDLMQIASFPDIDGSAIDAVSAIIDIKLYRDDNDVSGDVLVKEFDLHYQIDDRGSRQKFVK